MMMIGKNGRMKTHKKPHITRNITTAVTIIPIVAAVFVVPTCNSTFCNFPMHFLAVYKKERTFDAVKTIKTIKP